MDSSIIVAAGFVALFSLMALRVPVGMALGFVGITGFGLVVGFEPALNLLALSSMRTATDYNFAVVPLFILMGVFARESGISTELFATCSTWLGRLRGGMALSTVTACAGFSAISGSSVATSATMAQIAMPEMRRRGYDDSFATGTIAAGGTLGILIPPSMAFILYGILTENEIGVLFIAGILPAAFAVSLYMLVVWVMAVLYPHKVPSSEATSWEQKWRSLRGIWPTTLIFIFVIGGIYAGFFTVLEAAGAGAAGTLIVALVRRSLSFRQMVSSLVESVRLTGALFLILMGAIMFGNFLTITNAPQEITAYLTNLDLAPVYVMILILMVYMLLGCVLDAVAMILITVPIIYPTVIGLGYDPIWFGVMVVMVAELGLITPPYGMNVFVINTVLPEVNLLKIFKGVIPFIVVDLLRVALIFAFPIIALYLPRTMG